MSLFAIVLSFANVFVFECLSYVNKIHLLIMAYVESRDVCLKYNGWFLLVRENHPNANQFITHAISAHSAKNNETFPSVGIRGNVKQLIKYSYKSQARPLKNRG